MITALVTAILLFAFLCLPAKKWELKTRHFLPWSFLMAALGFVLTYYLTQALPNVPAFLFAIPIFVLAGVASVGAIMFFFFRDPERDPPCQDDIIVSPADGTVIYIKEIEDGRFPFAVKNNNTIPLSEFSQAELIPERGIQIGIAMNYLNVHINRSPIRGVVKMVQPVPGKFESLKHIHALLENERALLVFENDNLKVGIVQIASRLVRRIVSYVEPGQELQQGDRVGMIKFGSQVDVLLAYREDLKVQVSVGDEVVAGETTIMTCSPTAPGKAASSEPAQEAVS